MLDDARKSKISLPPYSEEWRTLAETASRERDSRKLIDLVERLCKALDLEREQRGDQTSTSPTS